MFKNLKLLFSSFFFLLFLFPGFSFLPSPSHSSLATSDPRTYPSVDNWTLGERKKTLSDLYKNGAYWFFPIVFGLKKLKFKSNGQDVVFYFDKLAVFFQPEILKQRKLSSSGDFDYTKIQGEAQQQLLQVYQKGTTNHVDGFSDVIQEIFPEYGNIFLNSIRPSLKKMKVLDLSKVDVSYWTNFSLIPLFDKIDNSFKKLGYDQRTLEDFALLSFSPTPNNAKNILNNAINKVWTPWLHTLQNAKAFGLTHLTVDKVSIDVSSLVNSKVQEASALSLKQIQTLKNLQLLGLEKLKSQVQTWIDTKLDSYKTKIQPILNNFIKTKIQKIEIKKTTYQIDFLFQDTNLNKKGSKLPQNAKTQLLALAKAKITFQELIDGLNDSLLSIFQKNWNAGKVSTYLLWLPVFDIQEVKLSQNQVFPVPALANAIKNMLLAEKFDFTKLEGKAKDQLLNLLNTQGKLKEEKIFQDDVWKQIKNHPKWKEVEGIEGEDSLLLIRTLLFKVQKLGIKKIAHPFFSEGYDLSFLQDNPNWKTISFKNLLARMTVKINGTNVEFYSSLFPNKVVFQVSMKKLDTIFSEITITNIIKNLESVITNSSKPKEQLETKNQGLIIGLSVGGSVLFLSVLGGFLYWFFKIKK